jgi:hypothetical protein
MENENLQNEIAIDEIGYMARLIDTKLTTFERMKVKKSTIFKILGALIIYSLTMISFAIIL